MADFYKNFDQIDQEGTNPPLQGLQYSIVTDITPAGEPVTLEFFKKHARIDFDTDDTLASVYLRAARQALEKYCQKSFGARQMRITAVHLPKNFRLAYGPVSSIVTTGFTNTGDILKEGGDDVNVVYSTLGIQDDTIKVAICRYATGLYIFRENIMDTKLDAKAEMDQAKIMLSGYRMITLF